MQGNKAPKLAPKRTIRSTFPRDTRATATAGSRHDAGFGNSQEGGADVEGAAVRVCVRCRPPRGSEPTFRIISEWTGTDKFALKLESSQVISGPRIFRCNGFLGPDAAQEAVFEQAAPIVGGTMKGCNGAILCYGTAGSGKTYTMMGPAGEETHKHDAPAAGIVQRVSRRIFEYIRDRSAHGEVFAVEAAYLVIYTPDGATEQLTDLLAGDDRALEVKEDPLNPQCFVCDGLRRVPIRTPDEMREVLNLGQGRLNAAHTSQNGRASKSHCLFMLSVESLAETKGMSGPIVQRGKLALVDLAGSEDSKQVGPPDDANNDMRSCQANGINRALASLGALAGCASGGRGSALAMLLQDCLGGSARSLLIANIGPELAHVDGTVKTMTFAQKMMAVRNKVKVNRIEQGQSSLLQMRQRHSDCIKLLQDKVSDEQAVKQEERTKLQHEMERLNKSLLTKESAEETMEELRDDQFRKIDETQVEMTRSISNELDRMHKQSLMDLDKLRKSVEQHVSHLDTSHHQRQAEEQEARVGKLQAELQDATRALRLVEEEASDLRVRLASAEERSKMLHDRQEDLKRDRTDFDEERKSLRHRSEQQWQRLTTLEGELQGFKAEAKAQCAELARLSAELAKDGESMRKEHERWRAREAELQQEIADLDKQFGEAQRDAELTALKAEKEQRDAISQLRWQIERLEAEAASREDQLRKAQQAQVQLGAGQAAAKQREEALRQQIVRESRSYQEELEDAKSREAELMHMLSEVQESIIVASSTVGQGRGDAGD